MTENIVSHEGDLATIEPVERLRLAFRWIEQERTRDGAPPLQELIDRAAARFSLTPSQVSWARWSLQPAAVAVQSKEPA